MNTISLFPRIKWGLLIPLLHFYSISIHSQTENLNNKIINANKIENNILIDGNLNEPEWQNAIIISDFIQREPDAGNLVSEKTEMRILYNKDNLYISFRNWDSDASKIIANEMKRDNMLRNNDAVEIYIDSFHDHRQAFFFSTNPLGAQFDGIVTLGIREDKQNWDWNGVWDCVSTIDDKGWTVEIEIPFKTIRFKDADKHSWGFNAARIIPRKREEAYWSPIARELSWTGRFRADIYGHLDGIDSISQPSKTQLKPFILTGIKRDFEENKPYEKTFDIGFDGKYLLTSDITADFTFNTDFAQVEADQEQVNLTRFELFFPEKRDFFLEGASTFRFGEREYSPWLPVTSLYFSRRIGLSEDNEMVPLIGGVKLTGSTGGYQLGFLNMLTDKISYINDDDEHINIPRNNFSVLRVKKNIFSNSYVGILGINKESLDDKYFNRTFGIDANIFLNDNTEVSGFIAKTSTPDLNGNDMAFFGDILYSSDMFGLTLSQNSIQENFNPEVGFAPRTGIRTTYLHVGYFPRPDILNIKQIFIFNEFFYIAKQNNQLDSRYNHTGLWTEFKNASHLFSILHSNYENIDEEFEISDSVFIQPGIYRYNNLYNEYVSDFSKPVSGKLSLTVGQFYDGNILGLGAGVNLKIGNQFTANLDYSRNKVEISAGNFTTDLLSARFVYTFSPKMYLKTFVQWNSNRDAVITNIVYNFIHTQGSDLYFVYNEELDTSFGRTRSKNRTALLKFTYLFSI